jgi:tetratricopeptide (TPR) repeat protein
LICRIILLLVLLIDAHSVGASEVQMAESERQFLFAESLFKEKDFQRAITEYKRFIFLFPEDINAERSAFKVAECYYRGAKWQEAIEAFNRFLAIYTSSSLTTEAQYIRGLAQIELGHYNDALSSFHDIIKSGTTEYEDKAKYQSAMVMLKREDWLRARQMFLEVPRTSSLAVSSRSFASGLEHINDIPEKSPAVAGGLAAIMPGVGHVYTERYRDAVVAFLLNGSFIWAAVELFKYDNNITGGIVTFIELGWYTGNIYSAVGSAHKYNRRAKTDFIQRLRDAAYVSWSFDVHTSGSQLLISFRY